ncbi:hypothetical protein ACJA23_00985 [Mycoplasma corogypsi]|uniref:hypothetical protein n=1 Tax=Mycoplasma corogypsi TaxID=2106 RepID=UPI003872C049
MSRRDNKFKHSRRKNEFERIVADAKDQVVEVLETKELNSQPVAKEKQVQEVLQPQPNRVEGHDNSHNDRCECELLTCGCLGECVCEVLQEQDQQAKEKAYKLHEEVFVPAEVIETKPKLQSVVYDEFEHEEPGQIMFDDEENELKPVTKKELNQQVQLEEQPAPVNVTKIAPVAPVLMEETVMEPVGGARCEDCCDANKNAQFIHAATTAECCMNLCGCEEVVVEDTVQEDCACEEATNELCDCSEHADSECKNDCKPEVEVHGLAEEHNWEECCCEEESPQHVSHKLYQDAALAAYAAPVATSVAKEEFATEEYHEVEKLEEAVLEQPTLVQPGYLTYNKEKEQFNSFFLNQLTK